MSRGLGTLQGDVKRVLTRAAEYGFGTLRFTDIRAAFVVGAGGDPQNDMLRPSHERSIKRALKGLVDRRDVVVVGGEGGPGDPYRYTTIECLAAATGAKVRNKAHAWEIINAMHDKAMQIGRP